MQKHKDIDFRFGNYQDVLADTKDVSVIICDPPYSEKTHKGRRTGSNLGQHQIGYESLTKHHAFEFAQFWSDKCKWWVVMFADHITRGWHEEAWQSVGWYVFGPVLWVKPNAPPRMSGDGPTVSTEDIMVARRKINLPPERSGSRRGHYIFNNTTAGGDVFAQKSFPGAKPINLMKALVLDYTIPGDLVCDPYAGMGTTLIASVELDRLAIGSERMDGTYDRAMGRIEAGITRDMFAVN